MKKEVNLPKHFIENAEKSLSLLTPLNIAGRRDVLQISLSGYTDVFNLLGDIIAVSILALADGEPYSLTHIPSPETHVSNILSLALNLIPYEEASVLDELRYSILAANPAPANNATEFQYGEICLSVFNEPPSTRWEDSDDYLYNGPLG